MRTLLVLIALIVTALPAVAQTRPAPALSTPNTFVEQVDQGAPGDFAWVSLRDADGADDLVIYDRSTGAVWLVRNYGPIYGTSFPASFPIGENACGLTLRPGLTTLIATDIDADGRDDLIGHNKHTGLVVRYFARGLAHGCVQ